MGKEKKRSGKKTKSRRMISLNAFEEAWPIGMSVLPRLLFYSVNASKVAEYFQYWLVESI